MYHAPNQPAKRLLPSTCHHVGRDDCLVRLAGIEPTTFVHHNAK
ncbi:hypothetical protein POHY109586_01440 [Polaromonas hydrogenivorans]